MKDVLLAPKFELTTYRKDGKIRCKTTFNKSDFKNKQP
jgi:hypothetical protein